MSIRNALFALVMSTATMVAAGEAGPAVQREINSLLSRLETSGCRFNRNGKWYAASEAKSHMLTKLHYIENRTTLVSTEQFIELAGSKSSFSGKPYLVQCGDSPAQPSAVWLTTQLHLLRSASQRP